MDTPTPRAHLQAALRVIGALDHVLRESLGIDMDDMIPEWTDMQRDVIREARAERAERA